MTPADTARVLTRISGVDQRTIGKTDVAAWHETIGHLDLDDCLEAVRRFFAAHADRRILPADIVAGVKVIREERLQRSLEPPPPNPDDVDGYLRQVRSGRRRIAAAPEGTPAVTSSERPGGPPPEGVRQALDQARAACASASATRRTDTSQEPDGVERQARVRAAGEAARTRRGDPSPLSMSDLREIGRRRRDGGQS